MPLENTDFTQNQDFKELEREINAAANEMRNRQSRTAARNARNTSGKTSYDEVLDKINNYGDKTAGALGTIGSIAAGIGGVIQGFKNGQNNAANVRPINDIQVGVETSTFKGIGILLVILLVGALIVKKSK